MSQQNLDSKPFFKLTPLKYNTKLSIGQETSQQEIAANQSAERIEEDAGEVSPSENNHQKNQNLEEYLDMYRLNPDWLFAEMHGEATKPGISDLEEEEKCICCLKRIKTRGVPLCENSKELEFLGYGFPLFYIFLKYVMIVMLIQILNYSIMELYISIDQNYEFCIAGHHRTVHDEEILCTSFMVLLSNISDHISNLELVLRATSYFTLLASLLYVRDVFTKTWMYYQERKKTYANFSVLIDHLPIKETLNDETLTIGQRLRRFFGDEQIFPSKPEIMKINLEGELEHFQELEEEIKSASSAIGKIKQEIKELRESEMSEETEKKIQELRRSKTELRQKKQKAEDTIIDEKIRLKELIAREDLNCDKAIVCFQTEPQRIAVQKAFKKINKDLIQRHFTAAGLQIEINKAPEPRQINWKYVNVKETDRLKRRIFSWAIFVLVLTALTVGIYFLFTYTSHKIETTEEANTAAAIEFSYILGIIIFNKFILVYLIHQLVEYEMHRTGETFQFSLMLKYALGLFFTTAVIALLVEGALRQNVYTEEYGIAEEETIMFFMITFLVPLIWLINPWYLFKLIQRKRFKGSPFITQYEANKLMEEPEYLLGKRYGQILESFWFTFLYACLLPFGSVLIFFALGLYYWVDKYNLLRRSSILQGISGDLCMKALFLLEFVLVLKPAGELIFDSLLRHNWHVMSVVELCIGFTYLLLPISQILKFFHPQKFMHTKITYSQLLEKYSRSYELYNPLTKQVQLRKHFQGIEKSSVNESQIPNLQSKNSIKKKHCYIRPRVPEKQNKGVPKDSYVANSYLQETRQEE